MHIVCPHCLTTNRIPERRLLDPADCGQCQQALFTGQPINLNEAAFQRYSQRDELPLVVDYWAPWCGPCNMMAPAYAQAATELEPFVRLAKVNTEVEQALAGRANIRSIPTIVMYRQGQEIGRQSGALDQSSLTHWIRSQLG